jgi:hypothetical protein
MVQEETGRLLVMQDGTMHGMITKTGLRRFLEIKQMLEASAAETPLALAGRTSSWC